MNQETLIRHIVIASQGEKGKRTTRCAEYPQKSRWHDHSVHRVMATKSFSDYSVRTRGQTPCETTRSLGFARRTLRSKEPVSELQALYSLNVFFDILRQNGNFSEGKIWFSAR